jgi:LysM repeat protein
MKRISFLMVVLALCSAPTVRAQDLATQERLDKLAGRIDDLERSQEVLRKQVNEMSRELASLREQANKPNTSYASHEDLKSLAAEINKVDRKRVDDAEKVQSELVKLRKLLEGSLTGPKSRTSTAPKEKPPVEKPAGDEKVFPYVIQKDDTLEAIVQAYKEKNIKVTVPQILKANPGLKPERLKVGQKIFIPAPQQ